MRNSFTRGIRPIGVPKIIPQPIPRDADIKVAAKRRVPQMYPAEGPFFTAEDSVFARSSGLGVTFSPLIDHVPVNRFAFRTI